MNNSYLLHESGGVDFCSLVGEASELVFNFRAQEIDGGQRDVCILKVLLNLICVLSMWPKHFNMHLIKLLYWDYLF